MRRLKALNSLRYRLATGPAGPPGDAARSRSILNLGMLYVSKSGAVLVGILILPQFSKLLGTEQFGIVAVAFSLQALLLTLDLGMSTLLSRDVAADVAGDSSWAAWRTAERVVSMLYAALIPLALIASTFVSIGLEPPQVLAAMLLFWALTIQNIGQTALLAKRRFLAAGSVQLIGVAARGVGTLVALRIFGANLSVFFLFQLVFAALQMLGTRALCTHHLLGGTVLAGTMGGLEQCLQMSRRARSLMLFSLAGAAVMQLDKPLIGALSSVVQVTPYYLAGTLCLTPLSLFATPVAQYFQPHLVSAVAAGDELAAKRVLRPYSATLVAVIVFPSALLWTFRETIVEAWLGRVALVGDVLSYTAILLPGAALGALGFIPFGILIARQDYRFQAVASAALSLVTLCAAAECARQGSIRGVCWVYACYHATSTLVSWIRCCMRSPFGTTAFARSAALDTVWMGGAALLLAAATIALGKNFH